MNNEGNYEDSHVQNYDTGRNINDTYYAKLINQTQQKKTTKPNYKRQILRCY